MWDIMLSGTYSPPQILEIANNDWGFRTRKTKKLGGKELSRSGIYRIFTNPFYAGIIRYGGQEYEGKHKPMITLSEYNRVQFLLGRKGKPRPKKHTFAFTGLIRCSECGCLYTAETKRKLIKCSGEVKEYTYYHCTRKRRDYDCSQKKVIRDDVLEEQIADEIGRFTILPEFRDWALDVLREEHAKEVGDRNTIYESQQKALNQAQAKLDRLVDMRLNELLTDAQYSEKKNELEGEVKKLRRNVRETEERADNWLELTEDAFNFATHAREAFLTGDIETKKQILMALGSNPTIKDGKLTIHANEWLVPIENAYPALEAEYKGLEPAQSPENKERTAHLSAIRSTWRRGWDSNPRYGEPYTCSPGTHLMASRSPLLAS
jgi:site-specific DNA recombinase